MKTQWTALMRASGLPVSVADETETGTDSANVAARAGMAANADLTLYDNAALAVIDIAGKDAGSFLQSQLCNDLLKLPAGRAQISGYCTPKGRLLALFTVFATGEYPGADAGASAAADQSAGVAAVTDGAPACYRLLVPAGIVEGFLKRLRMFVMRADVTITERDDLVCMGVGSDQGTDIRSLLTAASGRMTGGGSNGVEQVLGAQAFDVPALDEQAAAMTVSTLAPDWAALRWSATANSGQQRHLLVGPINGLADLWGVLGKSAMVANHAAWRLGDIGAGLPRVAPTTLEAFVPQMVNLHLIDALSFTKGCYPGQEIVARMQYLGKLKRHMRRFRLVADEPHTVLPGSALTAGSDANAGEVVDAVRDGQSIELLAVVKVAAVNLQAGSAALEALELPYELPTLEQDIDAGLPPVEGVAVDPADTSSDTQSIA